MTDKGKTKKAGQVRMGRKSDRPYWILVFSIFVRAIHQVGAAVFLASFLLPDSVNLPHIYLIIVSVSGVILLITEGIRHRQWFRELIGISTTIKLVFWGLAYHDGLPAMPTALFSFILASICSHAPKTIRHRLLF